MALKDQFPTQYQEWEAAGGVDDNFKTHLVLIGALPATDTDYLQIATALTGTMHQLLQQQLARAQSLSDPGGS